ncbi:MAG: glycosyltransferase family 39 protein [Candidatus Kaiserbacteria bacterium]|nr:glycosyltransferase family 39 protein [Candidatus Kaiserbacteria bacterium]
MSFIRAHKIEVSIFFLALLVRLCYFGLALHAHDWNLIDTSRGADGYFNISQNILSGNGFSSENAAPFAPNSFRVPLQPYFLAWSAELAGSYWLPLIFTLLISCFIPIIAMRLTRRLSSSRAIVLGTGIFLALEPVSILHSILFYSEPLFMLFFFLSLLYLFNYFEHKNFIHLIFSAAFLGFATLTRPTTEYLPIIIAIIIVWEARAHLTRKVWLRTGTYLLVFFIVLAPWLYRNKVQFGIFALTPQTGVNLYANLLPSVLSIENGTSFDAELTKLQLQGVSGPNKTDVAEAQDYTNQAVPLLLEHPTAFAFTAGTVEIAFFTHDGVLNVLRHLNVKPDLSLGTPALFLLVHDPLKLLWFIGHYLYSPIILVFLARIIWIIVTLCFFIGAVRYIRKEGLTPHAATMLATVFYLALTTIIVGLTVNARYRLPAEALIVPFALYGLLYLKTLWYRSR